MAIVYADTIEPRKPTQDITLGTSGETITLPGNDLRVNTVKDKGGNTLWTSNGSGTLSSLNGAFEGNLKLLNTVNASTTSEIVFSNTYINSTYDIYVFKYIGMHPSNDTVNFQFFGSENNGAGWNIRKTTCYISMWVAASGNSQDGPLVDNSYSQGNTTTEQTLGYSIGNDNEYGITGELWLFSPSTSTSVTHFMSFASYMKANNEQSTVQLSGYYGEYSGGDGPGTTIDAIKFVYASGTMDTGTIKLYGIL